MLKFNLEKRLLEDYQSTIVSIINLFNEIPYKISACKIVLITLGAVDLCSIYINQPTLVATS